MARLNKVCLLFVFVMGSLAIGSTGEAQIVRKTLQGTVGQVTKDIRETRRDYRLDKPFQYQPSDPWYRGKVFNVHTGHYGLFYNCDDEECKRNSPYICWKVHHERDFPKWKRPRYYIQQDLNRILSRIGNGGCAPNAPCQSCADCVDGQVVENAEVSSEAIVQRDDVAPGVRVESRQGAEVRTANARNPFQPRNAGVSTSQRNVREASQPNRVAAQPTCNCPECKARR